MRMYFALIVNDIDLTGGSRDDFTAHFTDLYLARVNSDLPLDARATDR